ncbi:hypothetical protein PI125_g25267 [Phytophthora idaei]|nr:hypothetical protein PI125_g25267 [Phytophthora idaei]
MADYKLFWNNCKELGSAASESDEPCQRDGDRRNGAMTGTGADVSDVRLTDLDPSDGRTPRPVAADATEGDGMNPNEESLVCALKAAGTLNVVDPLLGLQLTNEDRGHLKAHEARDGGNRRKANKGISGRTETPLNVWTDGR